MFNTWRLQLLVQFEVLGTMHRVAEVMNVSASTVSQQLSLLERETNTVLFERAGRRVRLTLAGHEFARQVHSVLGELELIENSMNGKSSIMQGTVRVAAFASALRSIVIPAAVDIREQYPSLETKMFEMEPGQSIPALDLHQTDIAIVAYFGKPTLDKRDRKLVALGSDALKIVVGQHNELAQRTSTAIDALDKQRWAMEFDSAYLSDYLKHLCRESGFVPQIGGVFASYAAMQEAVRRDLMICGLPELAILSDEGVSLLDLAPARHRNIFMVTRASQRNVKAVQAVYSAIQASAKQVLNNAAATAGDGQSGQSGQSA